MVSFNRVCDAMLRRTDVIDDLIKYVTILPKEATGLLVYTFIF